MAELTKENYYSPETDIEYMSFSQFKKFMECEEKALAIIEQRYEEPKSKALLQGGYIDAYFSGELEEFKENNPDIFSTKGPTKGELKSDFAICNTVIEAIEADKDYFEFFYNGQKQVIVTGRIMGVPCKGKIDFLYDNRIVDAKSMASADPVWSEERKMKIPFYSFYRYDLQGAFYRELVRQTTGKTLPFYLAPVTKEETPQKLAYSFSDEVLDLALEEIKAKIQRFDRIKKHLEEPIGCGKCNYCKSKYAFDVLDIKTITKEDM